MNENRKSINKTISVTTHNHKLKTSMRSSGGLLPARYVLGIMGCLGVTLALMMRACLAITITEMTRDVPLTTSDTPPTIKPVETIDAPPESCIPAAGNESVPQRVYTTLDAKYNWDERTQGYILSSFYYGYILTHIPGSMLSQRFGGKHTLGLGFLSTALLTLLTPLVASYGSSAMIVLRFFEGVGEGTTFPALATLLAQWSPPNERSFMTTLVFSGIQVGLVLAIFLSGLIMTWTAAWGPVFFIFGTAAALWFALWCLLCYDDPKSHPYISKEERSYLLQTIGAEERPKNLNTPWGSILTSRPVWALIIAEMGRDYGFFLMATDLPKYMSEVIGVTVAENGVLSSLPFLLLWLVGMISSALADLCIARNIMSRTNVRKLFGTLSSVLPGIGALAASYVGCNATLVTLCFTLGMAFMGFVYASSCVNPIDLSPNFSATIMALNNGLGCVSGTLAPLSVGFLTENKTIEEWRVLFWIMFLSVFCSNFVFLLFGSGEVQHWDNLQPAPR